MPRTGRPMGTGPDSPGRIRANETAIVASVGP